MNKQLLLVGLAIGISGCTTIGNKAEFEKNSFDRVYPRAEFDMDCPKEKLKLTIINANRHGYPETIGVRGCGHKAVYVRPDNQENWILNTNAKAEK